jgi:hypothetical protein
MIYERRAYTFRHEMVPAFWDAQPTWNTDRVFGEILQTNIGYFEVVSPEIERIVHLYRFDTLNQWRETYDRYYAAQNPAYFALVRPLMLAQENAFLITAPGQEALARWADPTFKLIDLFTEVELQLHPGGLPAYWKAYGELLRAEDQAADSKLAAVHQVLIGSLHRIFRYTVSRSLDEAHAADITRRASPVRQELMSRLGTFVAMETVQHLRPAPLARLRSCCGF